MVKFKDFSRPFSVFQVLVKANIIFKDFSRQSCIFKYFSSLCKPCRIVQQILPVAGLDILLSRKRIKKVLTRLQCTDKQAGLHLCCSVASKSGFLHQGPYTGHQIRVCIGNLFSSFLTQNICCGYSKELSQ